MRVKCIKNKLGDFDGELKIILKNIIYLDDDSSIGLIIGKEYVVYAIDTKGFLACPTPLYFVCEESDDKYPVRTSAVFFEIVDPKPSKYWNFAFHQDEQYGSGFFIPEWAANDQFYERLIDGEEAEETLFKEFKELMDQEATETEIGFYSKQREIEANINDLNTDTKEHVLDFVKGYMSPKKFEESVYGLTDLEKLMPPDLYLKVIEFDYKFYKPDKLHALKKEIERWLIGKR